LLLPGHEVKLLFFAIDVEADFFGSNINLHPCGAQERSPKDERRFFCGFHIEHHEVNRDKVIRIFTGISSAIPARKRTDESASWSCIGVGARRMKFNLSKMTLGITLTLAPRLHKA
jgi:hypothetical protein